MTDLTTRIADVKKKTVRRDRPHWYGSWSNVLNHKIARTTARIHAELAEKEPQQ